MFSSLFGGGFFSIVTSPPSNKREEKIKVQIIRGD